MLCRVLQVARSAFYAWMAAPDRKRRSEAALRVQIHSIYKASRSTYGSPRIAAALRNDGVVVNHKKVERIMRAEGLQGVPRKRFRRTTNSNHANVIARNILDRDFKVSAPNRVWVGDITYLRVGSGWAYLAVLIDLYSRKVIGWAIEDHMRTQLIGKVFRQAYVLRDPCPGLIHHSDRGVQYTSDAYVALLRSAGVIQSMSRKGDCWDNAVAESFFGTFKQELVKGRPFASIREARAEIGTYLHHFYNPKRLHSTLGFRSPAEVERQHQASVREAA
jgi:putative transposase